MLDALCENADDIILLCPSLHGLQQMIDTCCNIASLLSLEFNINKFHYIVFGSFYKKNLSPLFVGGNSILSCLTVKYLGVHLVSGRDIKSDLMPVKRAFYYRAAFNADAV